MSSKQTHKIVCNADFTLYFWDHSFKTAYQHAMSFIKRNEGKYSMKLYSKDWGNTTKTNWKLHSKH